MKTQFITDDYGKRLAAIVPIKIYQKMIEALEDLEDIRLYKQAKDEQDNDSISLEDYLKQRAAKHA